jgi:type II secretory pathway pseudopilin PulG
MQFKRPSLLRRFLRGMTATSEERREKFFSWRPSAVAAIPLRGMTLIEVVVGTALISIVFLAIFAAFQISIDLVFSTKAATGANALVNERLEYIRGLGYDSIGTVNGIPSGPLVQVEQKTLNGISYTISTLVQYIDDPVDGSDAADTNAVTADYKSIKVSADWVVRGKPRTTFAVTRIAPKGMETLAAGGTLRINVFNTLAAPVSGATVRILRTGSPSVDVSIDTGSAGSVAFPGTPPASGYQVTVTKTGYSSAQTYSATVANPNPNPGHVTVVNKTTTTLSLSIDLLGSLLVSTFSPKGPGTFTDTFTNSLQLSATSSAAVSGGVLKLEGSAGAYPAQGSATSVSIAPPYLSNWNSFSWNASTSPEASALVSLYYFNGTDYVLIQDAALPGNSAGFATSPVNISALSAVSYTNIRAMANLSSTHPDWTPEIRDWSASYIAGPTPLPNVPFSIRGAKTTGTSAGGSPIYKFTEDDTTNTSGTWLITPIEADAYTITLPSGSSYAIAELCPIAPSVQPGQNATVSLVLAGATTNSLRVVISGGGNPLPNATVTLTGNSVNQQITTSSCGQGIFTGIPAGTYTASVSAAGYQTAVDANVSVSGASTLSVTLSP